MKKICVILIIILICEILIIAFNFEKFIKKTDIILELRDADTLWCATFDLALNELKDQYGLEKLEFLDDSENKYLNELNERNFTKDMISKDSYNILVRDNIPELSKELENLVTKEQLKIFNNQARYDSNGLVIVSTLDKEFEFLEEFDQLSDDGAFNIDISGVSYFGIGDDSDEKLYKNIEVLYYWYYKNFAVKLKTKNGDEIICYTLEEDSYNKSFEELYEEVLSLAETYEDDKEFTKRDVFSMPKLNINCLVNYDSLLR